ncbi:MAG TPA: division/cell wall cluster transcriptional repressor MraZ [Candidatus Onthocola gallistercoris]|uniref:Transcriptional regulator MraZ n=1 Tax=Candidatus Onthocola gallistercoris TaxID=2840876 RepID=A0A9D1HGL4_9FIRM|nr:division/cell wall cluster transcriptional repressor MraZ [Candidatus Onthocola gallistercoris]
MFIGEYNHSIDAKGRLIVPSKFREALGDTFFVTKGLDGCLSVYPTEEWKIFESKLRSLPITNKNARKFTRFFLAGASECEIDKQGRILIPAPLREYAGLVKDAVLVGVSSRIEIWSRDKWAEINDIDVDDMSDVAEHMEELGISL